MKNNLSNKQINDWYVIELSHYKKSEMKRLDKVYTRNLDYWKCKCKCGGVLLVRGDNLRSGGSKNCKKCSDKRSVKIFNNTIPNEYWRHLVKNAQSRGIKVQITPEESYVVLQNQKFKCNLTGMDIYMCKSCKEYKEGTTTASLDRIDSNKEYTIDNIQWIHKDLNLMKHTFSQSYFIKLCNLIYENKKI